VFKHVLVAMTAVTVLVGGVATPAFSAGKAPTVTIATPDDLVLGSAATISGRVSTSGARTVTLQIFEAGRWRTVKQARSTAAGAFSFKSTLRSKVGRAKLRVYVPKSGRRAAGVSAARNVFVGKATTLTAAVSAGLVEPGSPVTLTATVSPKAARPVALQRYSAGRWQTVGTAESDAATGRATFTLPTSSAGTASYRASVNPAGDRVGKVSAARTVTVQGPYAGPAVVGFDQDGALVLTQVPAGTRRVLASAQTMAGLITDYTYPITSAGGRVSFTATSKSDNRERMWTVAPGEALQVAYTLPAGQCFGYVQSVGSTVVWQTLTADAPSGECSETNQDTTVATLGTTLSNVHQVSGSVKALNPAGTTGVFDAGTAAALVNLASGQTTPLNTTGLDLERTWFHFGVGDTVVAESVSDSMTWFGMVVTADSEPQPVTEPVAVVVGTSPNGLLQVYIEWDYTDPDAISFQALLGPAGHPEQGTPLPDGEPSDSAALFLSDTMLLMSHWWGAEVTDLAGTVVPMPTMPTRAQPLR
jgi:hypothetical protein